ncbi:MAG: phage tail terminator-like protein [Gammaproteobacteria bacterium]|nr:phage tail terminator-like protein [Gammaproteobacteria bacterium]
MSYTLCLQALEDVVNTYATANSLPVVYDGMERDPVDAEVSLVCSFMPGRSSGATLGQTGVDERPGIYQISVRTHRGRGSGVALGHADALVSAFKRKQLTVGGTTVHAFRAWPSGGIVDGDTYSVPVTVQWLFFE